MKIVMHFIDVQMQMCNDDVTKEIALVNFVMWTLDISLHHKFPPQIPADKYTSQGKEGLIKAGSGISICYNYSIAIPALLCRGFLLCTNLSVSQMLVPRLEADEILWDGDCDIS